MNQSNISFLAAGRALLATAGVFLVAGNSVWAQSDSGVALSAGVSGRIAEVRVSVGDQVNAGDVLVMMDTTPMQAKLDAARAQLHYAQEKYKLEKADYARQEELYNEGSMSTVELQMEKLQVTEAAAELAQARADTKVAEWQLQQSELVAPVGGEITQISYPGQFVNVESGAAVLVVIKP